MSGILHTKDYKHFKIIGESTEIEFDNAKDASKALPGDIVTITFPADVEKISSCTVKKRKSHINIVGVLELTSKYRFGFNTRSVPIYMFTPYDESYPQFLVASSERDKTINQIALIDFIDWTDTTFPRGAIVKLFGPVGNRIAELDALYWRYSPYTYPKGIQDSLVSLVDKQITRELIDWSWSANIDPPGCKDIDDVISLEFTSDGFKVAISIADVAEYVKPEDEVDKIASLSAQTLYQDGRPSRNMLPIKLCENIITLSPGEKKLAVSLIFNWSSEKGPHNLRWAKTCLINQTSHTYESIIGDTMSLHIHKLSTSLRTILGLQNPESTNSHDWIEAIMVFYNVEAAKKIASTGVGILRKHDAADASMLATLPVEAAFLAYKAAVYIQANDSCPTHWGLSQPLYCHASSPLRRYADIVNQRVLKDEFSGDYNIDWLNKRQKDANAFNRDYTFINICLDNPIGTIECVVINIEASRFKSSRFSSLEEKSITFSAETEKVTSFETLRFKTIKFYSPKLKQILSIKDMLDTSLSVGLTLRIDYFCNMELRCWKRRVVFRL